MKKIVHKNQLVITTLAVLIAVAGYISFDRSNADSDEVAKEANASVVEEDYVIDNTTYDIFEEIDDVATVDNEVTLDNVATADNGAKNGEEVALDTSLDTSLEEEQGVISEEEDLNPGETVLTSLTLTNSNYAAEVKLNREQVRSKNREVLTQIIENDSLTDEQKQAAVDQMVEMTDIAQKEVDAEMLLEAKGFTNAVVSISANSCDVVVDMGDVTDAKRAQVEDIVKRKTGIAAENIVITAIDTNE